MSKSANFHFSPRLSQCKFPPNIFSIYLICHHLTKISWADDILDHQHIQYDDYANSVAKSTYLVHDLFDYLCKFWFFHIWINTRCCKTHFNCWWIAISIINNICRVLAHAQNAFHIISENWWEDFMFNVFFKQLWTKSKQSFGRTPWGRESRLDIKSSRAYRVT